MKKNIDFVKNILRDKEITKIYPCDEFSPYLIQKYLSGTSPEYCSLINELLNTKLKHWNDNQQILNLLKIIIPKTTKIFDYFGENKNVNKSVNLSQLAKNYEISVRELKEMIKLFPEILNELADSDEKILKRIN